MPKLKEYIDRIEMEKIRREWLEEKEKFYFSVVDVMGILTDSTDARNYWKVLKNRLKNTQNKLVTECNQLKMRASDGKFYLTDTADKETMLELIKIVSPENFATFKLYFEQLERREKKSYPQENSENEPEGELLIDGYETEDSIIIQTMVAGIPKENISISVSCQKLIIKGERTRTQNISEENYLTEELYWGKFSRSVDLPADIEIDSATATIHYGLVTIKLKKIDKLVAKNVEIKIV